MARPSIKWDRTTGNVPFIVEVCIPVIEANGLDTEGIFRISGNNLDIQKYYKELDSGKRPPLESLDIHVVSGLLKQFLRDLNNPLMTWELYPLWIAVSNFNIGQDDKLEVVRQVCALLPAGSQAVMKMLFLLLNKVMGKSSVNKMSAGNLGIVFAPTLLRPKVESIEVILGDSDASNSLMQLLVINAPGLFGQAPSPGGLPPKAQPLAELMAACVEEMEKASQSEEPKQQLVMGDIPLKMAPKVVPTTPEGRAAVKIQAFWRGIMARRRFAGINFGFQSKYNLGVVELMNQHFHFLANLQEVETEYLAPMREINKLREEQLSQAAAPKSKGKFGNLIKGKLQQRELATTQLATQEEMDIIFSNITTVQQVHAELAIQLETHFTQSWPRVSGLGNIMLNNFANFKVYVEYVNNYAKSKDKLTFCQNYNDNLRKWLQTTPGRSRNDGLTLHELLFLPISHMNTLVHLLERIMLITFDYSSEAHVEHKAIVKAVGTLIRMCRFVKNVKAEAEKHELTMIERVIEGAKDCIIRPTRKFVMRGDVTIASEKRHIFLFNDIAYVVKKKKGMATNFELKYIIEINDQCAVEDLEFRSAASKVDNGFIFITTQRNYQILCSTKEDKLKWMECIKSLIHKSARGVFGRSLQEIIDRDNRSMSTPTTIPLAARTLMNAIKNLAGTKNGILCTSGEPERVKQIVYKIEWSPDLVDLGKADPLDVGGALRLYLEQLPEPLIPANALSEFALFEDLEFQKISFSEFVRMLKSLPPENLTFLQQLLQLLHFLEKDPQSGLWSSTLAYTLNPAVIRPRKETFSSALLIDQPAQVLYVLIHNQAEMFNTIKTGKMPREISNSRVFAAADLQARIAYERHKEALRQASSNKAPSASMQRPSKPLPVPSKQLPAPPRHASVKVPIPRHVTSLGHPPGNNTSPPVACTRASLNMQAIRNALPTQNKSHDAALVATLPPLPSPRRCTDSPPVTPLTAAPQVSSLKGPAHSHSNPSLASSPLLPTSASQDDTSSLRSCLSAISLSESPSGPSPPSPDPAKKPVISLDRLKKKRTRAMSQYHAKPVDLEDERKGSSSPTSKGSSSPSTHHRTFSKDGTSSPSVHRKSSKEGTSSPSTQRKSSREAVALLRRSRMPPPSPPADGPDPSSPKADAMQECPNCHTPCPGHKFCTKCGASVASVNGSPLACSDDAPPPHVPPRRPTNTSKPKRAEQPSSEHLSVDARPPVPPRISPRNDATAPPARAARPLPPPGGATRTAPGNPS
mmetsp:Transcript_25997/g.65307  ORF Transcript_25997/g.65307 Transcript_25997/m.65307 type:complete len:1260 (+) Transcript_25997:679-4458(+)|eukprot:CAMPEP_0177636456 /NCGR_PEP_ID=MMETSP0447-20121125/4449_1 /TAXON_ID=0 /ORGANISM="Stygamoeba regulata, Strain BSH-02190019" /LENGTH=1259 /DNA_ID=CAMNT_0019138321 /DNA_START=595 /DNA_END=4374 /DNA_ORIENTATION=-